MDFGEMQDIVFHMDKQLTQLDTFHQKENQILIDIPLNL